MAAFDLSSNEAKGQSVDAAKLAGALKISTSDAGRPLERDRSQEVHL
jgi:hypothetical protein